MDGQRDRGSYNGGSHLKSAKKLSLKKMGKHFVCVTCCCLIYYFSKPGSQDNYSVQVRNN